MKWIGEHIWDFVSRFRNKVVLEDLAESTEEYTIMVKADGELVKSVHPMELSRLQVRNDEGSTIPAGAPLYSKGEIGGSERIKVGICDANDSTKMPCIGIAQAEMNTTSTKDNFAVSQGVFNTNISGFTSLSDGDILYVDDSGSAPYLTQNKSDIAGSANKIQNVGIVLKTNGTICQGLLVSAIGRTNDVPNLDESKIFLGDSTNAADTYTVTAGTNTTITKDETAKTLTFVSTDTNTTYTGSSGVTLSGTDFRLDTNHDARFNSVESTVFKSTGDIDIHMDHDANNTGNKIKFKANASTEVGYINDRGELSVNGAITGKVAQMFNMSFHDDLGTTKHWMPWSGTLEQSLNAYQEEVAMAMPYSGRIVSCLVRAQAINSSGNLTIGIETKEPGALVGSSWTAEEDETLAVGSTDANHAFHFVFNDQEHFDQGDLVAMSIRSDSDLSNSTYWYVTTVVEFDLNTPLGTSSAEYDTGQ